MNQKKISVIEIDGDTVEIVFSYNKACDVWHGDYPDFEENPRYTKSGMPWVNVISEGCPLATSEYGDCGSCEYLKKHNSADLIGVCTHEKMKQTS